MQELRPDVCAGFIRDPFHLLRLLHSKPTITFVLRLVSSRRDFSRYAVRPKFNTATGETNEQTQYLEESDNRDRSGSNAGHGSRLGSSSRARL